MTIIASGDKNISHQEKIVKSNQFQQWTIRLKVSPEERKRIHKEAIDNGQSIAEYVKRKVLGDLSRTNNLIEGKSA